MPYLLVSGSASILFFGFQCHETPSRAPLPYAVWATPLPLGCLHPFCHKGFLLSEVNKCSFPLGVFPSQMEVMSTILTISSVNPFTVHSNSLPVLSLLVFFCTSVFFGQFPLLNLHFCKMSHEFISGREGDYTTTRFAA